MNIAISRSIDRVIDQISGLSGEVYRFKQEMHEEIHDLKSTLVSRLASIETKIDMFSETQAHIKAKLIEYAFKTSWVILAVVSVFTIAHF